MLWASKLKFKKTNNGYRSSFKTVTLNSITSHTLLLINF